MQAGVMWKDVWQKWTIDKPAAFSDWLWDVFVVQLAAFLDRLTLRRIIALIPVVLFFLAYAHRIPVPPELMLLGDFIAYIDVVSALIVLGLLSRAATIFFIVKETTGLAVRLASGLVERLQRMDFRHRREGGVKNRKRSIGRAADDDELVVHGVAWA
jgi:hypothetical protein